MVEQVKGYWAGQHLPSQLFPFYCCHSVTPLETLVLMQFNLHSSKCIDTHEKGIH